MIWHVPGQQPHQYAHRTTHYDVVPTLMKEYLGVKNPEDDYSMGRLMTDSSPRLWQIVGSNLNYAFIIDKDSILEKTPQGSLDVYDSKMNPVKNYTLPVKQLIASSGRVSFPPNSPHGSWCIQPKRRN